jgi:hypothetical protein
VCSVDANLKVYNNLKDDPFPGLHNCHKLKNNSVETLVKQMFVDQMSVGQMSVGQMSVGQMSVGQMSVGQMSVGQML